MASSGDWSASQRAAMVTMYLYDSKVPVSVGQIADYAGITHSGAYKMLLTLSGVLPIVQDGRVWEWASDMESGDYEWNE